MPVARPRLGRILETVLYFRNDTRNAMGQLYDEVLGLREHRVAGGGYRLGNGLLLLFNADKSAKQSRPPPNGTTGRAHTCFVAADGAYDAWKSWIRQANIEILEEIEWTPPLSGRSFYFHDPAGNVLEIADRDIWPKAEPSHDATAHEAAKERIMVMTVLETRVAQDRVVDLE